MVTIARTIQLSAAALPHNCGQSLLQPLRQRFVGVDVRNQGSDLLPRALDGILAHQRSDHLFHDVLDDPSTFVETNVAQQVAYAIFRLASLIGVPNELLEKALLIRDAVLLKVDRHGLVRGICGSPTFTSSSTA